MCECILSICIKSLQSMLKKKQKKNFIGHLNMTWHSLDFHVTYQKLEADDNIHLAKSLNYKFFLRISPDITDMSDWSV